MRKFIKDMAGWLRWLVLCGCLQCGAAGTNRYSIHLGPMRNGSFETGGIGVVLLDLATRVSAIASARVQLSGVHTNGWFVGDGTEEEYVGRWEYGKGFDVCLGTTIHDPPWLSFGLFRSWFDMPTDGPFEVNLDLAPTPGWNWWGGPIPEGKVVVEVHHEPAWGFGTVTREPIFQVTEAVLDLVVVGEWDFAITQVARDGTLTWPNLPVGGAIELLAADEVDGPWHVVQQLPTEARRTRVDPAADGAARFYRLRWVPMPLP